MNFGEITEQQKKKLTSTKQNFPADDLFYQSKKSKENGKVLIYRNKSQRSTTDSEKNLFL